jgi:hypothetical protein
MFLLNLNVLLISALCAVSHVSAAANVAQSIDYMNAATEKIETAHKSLDNYNGGISSALGVARSLMVAQTAARTAREHLGGDDKMTPEEGDRYYESYTHMYPVLLDAIHTAERKVCS